MPGLLVLQIICSTLTSVHPSSMTIGWHAISTEPLSKTPLSNPSSTTQIPKIVSNVTYPSKSNPAGTE